MYQIEVQPYFHFASKCFGICMISDLKVNLYKSLTQPLCYNFTIEAFKKAVNSACIVLLLVLIVYNYNVVHLKVNIVIWYFKILWNSISNNPMSCLKIVINLFMSSLTQHAFLSPQNYATNINFISTIINLRFQYLIRWHFKYDRLTCKSLI